MSMCINLDACVSLMCELRSTELVINSSNKYSLLGIKSMWRWMSHCYCPWGARDLAGESGVYVTLNGTLDHLPCPHLPLSAPSHRMVAAILYHVILPTHHPLYPDTPDIKTGSTSSFPLKIERWSLSLCVVKPLTDKLSSWGTAMFLP